MRTQPEPTAQPAQGGQAAQDAPAGPASEPAGPPGLPRAPGPQDASVRAREAILDDLRQNKPVSAYKYFRRVLTAGVQVCPGVYAAGVCLAALMSDPEVQGKEWFSHDALVLLSELPEGAVLSGDPQLSGGERQPDLSVAELENLLQTFLGAYYTEFVGALRTLQERYPEELGLVAPRLEDYIRRESELSRFTMRRRRAQGREPDVRQQCAEVRELSRRLYELV